MLNVLLKRQFPSVATSDLKVGTVTINRSKFISGLMLLLEDKGITPILKDDINTKPWHPSIEEAISAITEEISNAAKLPIDHDTHGLSFVGSDEPFPFNERTGHVSPIATAAIESFWTKVGYIPPVEFMRRALKNIKLIVIPYNHLVRAKLINYIISLGLDIEVSMITPGPDGSFAKEIRYLNGNKSKSGPKKKNRPQIKITAHVVGDRRFVFDEESIKEVRAVLAKIYKKQKAAIA